MDLYGGIEGVDGGSKWICMEGSKVLMEEVNGSVHIGYGGWCEDGISY